MGTELVVIGEPGELDSHLTIRSRPDARATRRPPRVPRRRTESRRPRGAGACRPRPSSGESRRSSGSISRGGGHRARRSNHGGRRSSGCARASQGEGRREPLRGVRRLIAEHMARAHREVPPVTWVEECDFEDVPLDRLARNGREGVCRGARRVSGAERAPRRRRDRLPRSLRHRRRRADRGRAGRAGRAGREREGVDELASEIADLAERPAAGSLAADELRGSTFTVTSAGKLAGLFQTPIVNHPEVAILSIGRVAPRPVVRDGEVVVRQVGTIAVTFDHRVVDGARAAAFGLAVIRGSRVARTARSRPRDSSPLVVALVVVVDLPADLAARPLASSARSRTRDPRESPPRAPRTHPARSPARPAR